MTFSLTAVGQTIRVCEHMRLTLPRGTKSLGQTLQRPDRLSKVTLVVGRGRGASFIGRLPLSNYCISQEEMSWNFPSISFKETRKSLRKRCLRNINVNRSTEEKSTSVFPAAEAILQCRALPHCHHPQGKVRTLKARLSQLIKTSEK